MDGVEQPAQQLTSHELRELKKQQKLEQRQQQSAVTVAENRKKRTKTYAIIALLAVIASIGLWQLGMKTSITGKVAVEIGEHPSLGPQASGVKVVIFGDFQCPWTRKFWQNAYQKIVENYPDVLIAFWPTPTGKHSHDRESAQAAYCANEQGKFWEYAKLLFDRQGQAKDSDLLSYARELKLDLGKFNECYASGRYSDKVQEDYEKARSYGVVQTPTVNINGHVLSGELPFEDYKTFIEYELQQK